MRRLGACLALSLLAACASTAPAWRQAREPPLSARVAGQGLSFELIYSRDDSAEVGRIGSGLLEAGARVTARWGSFRRGLVVRLLPDHESLERAVNRIGHPWLRAWATGDQILLQSPRTWESVSREALDRDVEELLVHELTHALMYQQLDPEGSLLRTEVLAEEPPLWFREGMASVTAGQGPKRLTPAELSKWCRAHPRSSLLAPDLELVRTEKEAVYGAAHRAFERFLGAGGDQAVKDVLRNVRSGARFDDAFAAATGRQLHSFEAESIRSGFELNASAPAASGAGGP